MSSSDSYCSTCSDSQDSDCCDSDHTSLHESDTEWLSADHRLDSRIFYLTALSKACDQTSGRQSSAEAIGNACDTSFTASTLKTNERLRLSYTKLTSWVFNRKRFSIKKKSIKRKSSRKYEVRDNSVAIDSAVTLKSTSLASITPSISVSSCDNSNNQMINLIKEEKSADILIKYEYDFIVMYLTPPNDNNEKDFLVYSYPKSASKDEIGCPLILKLKGMFVTLSQVTHQITNQSIKRSSIAVNQLQDNEQVMTVAFIHEFNNILLLAMPQLRYLAIEVENIAQTVCDAIELLYSSLDSAFLDEHNHESLNNLFNIIHYLIEQNNFSRDYFFVNTIQRLLIDDDLLLVISDTLSEYEAMDWISDQSSIDAQECMSQFIVIGSCVLYKGFLIESHLPSHYLKQIHAHIATKGLTCLQRRQSIRLVSWREVYPSSQRLNKSNDFNENEGIKYYLAIVGIEYLIHCVLIEMPFLSVEPHSAKPFEIIVNESIRLLKIRFAKLGIVDEIEHCFNLHEKIAESICAKSEESKHSKSFSSLKDLLSLSSSPSTSKHISLSTSSLHSLDESSVSGSSKSYSSPSLQHSILSSMTSSSATSLSRITVKSNGLTNGSHHNISHLKQCLQLPENLICYLDIEDGLQILAGPLLQCPKEIFYPLFKKFTECCYFMSEKFRITCNEINECGKTFELRILGNSLSSYFKPNRFDGDAYHFDVIGRSESTLNEFYVCFQVCNSSQVFVDSDIKDLMYKLRLRKGIL